MTAMRSYYHSWPSRILDTHSSAHSSHPNGSCDGSGGKKGTGGWPEHDWERKVSTSHRGFCASPWVKSPKKSSEKDTDDRSKAEIYWWGVLPHGAYCLMLPYKIRGFWENKWVSSIDCYFRCNFCMYQLYLRSAEIGEIWLQRERCAIFALQ